MSIAKKEKRAIEYLKAFEPKDEPYYLCYSGGKDSDCIIDAWKHAMKEEYRPDVNETVNEWLEQFEKYMKKGGEK